MLRSILTAAMLCVATPALAYTDRVVEWHAVNSYLMPPADCMVGPVPPFDLEFLDQAEMDARFPSHDAARHHTLGYTLYAHSAANPQPYAIIYLSDRLPGQMMTDLLEHEKAHLRGCMHPGYTVHSDGTPVN